MHGVQLFAGLSAIITLPGGRAGAGKSLCYQLPALVGGGTVLVVSPLLALMRDQLAHLPPGMPAAMLWGGQPRAAAMAVYDDLRVLPPIPQNLLISQRSLHNRPNPE